MRRKVVFEGEGQFEISESYGKETGGKRRGCLNGKENKK